MLSHSVYSFLDRKLVDKKLDLFGFLSGRILGQDSEKEQSDKNRLGGSETPSVDVKIRVLIIHLKFIHRITHIRVASKAWDHMIPAYFVALARD